MKLTFPALFLTHTEMVHDATVSITLTPELERFVRERISAGRNGSVSDVVQDGLRLLEVQERERESALQVLKEKLQRAATQAERGETVDGEAFMNQLVARLEAKTGHPGAA